MAIVLLDVNVPVGLVNCVFVCGSAFRLACEGFVIHVSCLPAPKKVERRGKQNNRHRRDVALCACKTTCMCSMCTHNK